MTKITNRTHPPFDPPVTPPAPRGFRVGGVASGIKKDGAPDLGLLVSDTPCAVAGVFTTNAFCAAPVTWDRRIVARGKTQALVVNSGNANCATGKQGVADCAEMAAITAKALGVGKSNTLVSSTGVIGVNLPMAKLRRAIPKLAHNLPEENWAEFAEAIRTTDTVRKLAGATITIGGKEVRLIGIAKGSGMIHPNMATMLSYVATDAAIEPDVLQAIYAPVADATYNSLTVDGDTSTNDSAMVLANGAAGNRPIGRTGKSARAFAEALESVCASLARQLVRDGEGATKLGVIRVEGAASLDDARKAARAIATSSLVKTALFGEDANWGRVACALGYSGAKVKPEKTDIAIGPMALLKQGRPIKFSEARAKKILSKTEIEIIVNLNLGRHSATYWTSDLSYEYVRINADYRS